MKPGATKNEQLAEQAFDAVQKPKHYTAFGHECRDFSRHMHGAQCQAFQYVWRCDLKDEPIQDLEKACFWLRDWIDNDYSGFYNLQHFVPACTAVDRVTGPAATSSLDKLREVCNHFGYNTGRALEHIFVGEHRAALELLEREIERRRALVEVAPAPAGARSQRGNRAA